MIQYDPHRWLDHLFDVKGSLIPEITPRVLACAAWTVAIVVFDHHVTPLAMPATVHTLFTLPIALIEPFGWLTVPATLGVAYTFFGIEEIGVEIEDPFGHDLNDLALEELCGKIAKNLLAPTGHHDEADAHRIETGEIIKIGVE